MRSLRLANGQIKGNERRRRIKDTELGAIKVIDRARIQKLNRKTGQMTTGNAMHVHMAVPLSAELALQLDVRHLADHLRMALGEHFRNSVISGQKEDGSEPLPPLKTSTPSPYTGNPRSWSLREGLIFDPGRPFALDSFDVPSGARYILGTRGTKARDLNDVRWAL